MQDFILNLEKPDLVLINDYLEQCIAKQLEKLSEVTSTRSNEVVSREAMLLAALTDERKVIEQCINALEEEELNARTEEMERVDTE